MRKVIKTELTKPIAPHEWAIAANGIIYSVHVPIRPDGTIESGSAEAQADVTFSDLEVTLKAAGANASDVVLVQIFLTSLAHKSAVDEVYKRFFTEPYPVRACIAVSELPTPGTVIEVVATTAVET
ncbi:MAG: Rid family hydrolase [Arenicellales bacterium]